MKKDLYIQKYCKITNNQVVVDGKLVFDYDEEDTNAKSFFKAVYKNIGLKYPKFFKMDNLSKLSFLAAEYLLNDTISNKNIALVFSNKASSLDTDRAYQSSINDLDNYYPSPAVFVYTLPNIGIGEISIKHQLKSENAFFVFNDYNANFHHNYEQLLIQNKKSDAVLAGWVNFDEDSYEAFLYLVSEKGEITHTKQNLSKLYSK